MPAPAVIKQPVQRRNAAVRAASFNEADNTIEVIWTTGAAVRRYDWRSDAYYDEELVVGAGNVRLDRLNAGAPFLNTHADNDLADVIGSIVPGSAEIRAGKGHARVRLSVAPEHEGIVANLKAGVIRNISVGYRQHKIEKTEGDEGEIAVWRVIDWEPLEISAVPVPADPGAQVRSEGAQTYPATIIEMEGRMPEQNADDALEQRIAGTAERTRTATISDLATRAGLPALGLEHVSAGTEVAEFRRILLDRLVDDENRAVPGGVRSLTGAPVHASPRGMNDFDQRRARAMESALLHRVDPVANPLAPGAEVFVAMPLLEVARAAVEGSGQRTAGMSKMQIAAAALGQRSGGMLTTSDFPTVLANVANRTLRAAYDAAPQTFRPFVRVTTVSDFKEVSRVQISEAPALLEVGEHGEFQRGSLGEAAEKFRLATFGRIIGITRQAIVNDDLAAFDRIPRAFGIQAAQLESDLVWAQILSNPVMGDGQALFSTAHNNLLSPLVIGQTSVAEARKKMGLQVGIDGSTALNLTPEFMLVPKALEVNALQFITTITPAKASDAVPREIRNLTVISEPRLDLGIPRLGIAGAPGAYYFAAAAATVDLIELAYLEGQQGVYTETRMGFDIDGMEIKARLDVAAKVIDWRGFSKNAGA
jgi:HK97 family phage prohead protease